MKKRKPEPAASELDPNHPNYDAIQLKRSRLEAHRRRRAENSGAAAGQEWQSAAGKSGKKATRRRSKD